ncbi:MAG TPA: hypothetical protein PL185_05515 [Flavobacteriales bacterium]|nr:hypothetical protein [Flavobacteriales bacterium]
MEDQATIMESILEKGELYTQTNIELIRLKTIGKSAEVFSSLAGGFVIFVSVLIVLMMINIGAAIWIGSLFGVSYYGFFIVACFYLLITIIFLAFKNVLIKMPISNLIINNLYKLN